MKTVKILTVVALLVCLLFTLCACGESGSENPTTKPTTGIPKPTQPPKTPTEAPDKVLYTVTIQDENGNPVVGAMIQLCKEMCVPNKTNERGVAVFTMAPDDYKCSFLSLPAGYTYSTEETEFYFEDGSRELTIVLKAEG